MMGREIVSLSGDIRSLPRVGRDELIARRLDRLRQFHVLEIHANGTAGSTPGAVQKGTRPRARPRALRR